MKRKLSGLTPGLIFGAAALISGGAEAAGILSNGTVALGVKDSGALNVSGGTTIYGPSFTSPGSGTVGGTGVRGLFVNGTSGYEATYPGCLCVQSRTIIRRSQEQMRMGIVPSTHSLHRRLALQG
jgi:hypothetical protein